MHNAPESQSKINHISMRPGETNNSRVVADPATLEILGENYSKNFITLEEGMEEEVNYYRELFNK